LLLLLLLLLLMLMSDVLVKMMMKMMMTSWRLRPANEDVSFQLFAPLTSLLLSSSPLELAHAEYDITEDAGSKVQRAYIVASLPLSFTYHSHTLSIFPLNLQLSHLK